MLLRITLISQRKIEYGVYTGNEHLDDKAAPCLKHPGNNLAPLHQRVDHTCMLWRANKYHHSRSAAKLTVRKGQLRASPTNELQILHTSTCLKQRAVINFPSQALLVGLTSRSPTVTIQVEAYLCWTRGPSWHSCGAQSAAKQSLNNLLRCVPEMPAHDEVPRGYWQNNESLECGGESTQEHGSKV